MVNEEWWSNELGYDEYEDILDRNVNEGAQEWDRGVGNEWLMNDVGFGIMIGFRAYDIEFDMWRVRFYKGLGLCM